MTDRDRAILWCLSDLDPGMPLVEALGYLHVISERLEAGDRRAAQRVAAAAALKDKWCNAKIHDVPEMVRDLASDPVSVRMATTGASKAKLARHIRETTGCTVKISEDTAASLISALVT